MKEHLSIIRTEALSPALDFDTLRLEGIAHAQTLSGAIWTDYNEHDPGVTLLEYLCFAITDAGFRANFDLKDLLYAREKTGRPNIENAFYGPVDIYPTNPVTTTDYRRLLIDRVANIRNAWVEIIEHHPYGYRGLYRVKLQLISEIDLTKDKDAVIEEVRELMMSHRNLCEDLDEVIVLESEQVDLALNISIEPTAFGEFVVARIIFQLEHLLNPGIRYYTLEELKSFGYGNDEIFDGPSPQHGFVRPEALHPLPAVAYLSVLREEITRVEGVKMVDSIVAWKDGKRIMGDKIIPSPNTALRLHEELAANLGEGGRIQLKRDGAPVNVNYRQARQYLNGLQAKEKKGFQIKLDLSESPVVSSFRLEDIKAYRSFQPLLPAVYGLGAEGLPPNADQSRVVKAKQLKAYLMLFEQLLGDYLAQLAGVRQLFSIVTKMGEPTKSPEQEQEQEHYQTYFTQFPADIPDAESLFICPDKYSGSKGQEIEKEVKKISSSFDPAEERRNRFLDHLLARFGEIYNGDYLKNLPHSTQENLGRDLINSKARFLAAYPENSRNRGRAFNYLKDAWETDNVSGLKKRVALLTNLNILGEESSQTDRINAASKYYNRPLSELYPVVAKESKPGKADKDAPSITATLKQILSSGKDKDNYIIERDGKNAYQLYLNIPEIGKKGPLLPPACSLEESEAARDGMIKAIQKTNEQGEGFFIVEHLLLRPLHTPGVSLALEILLPTSEKKLLFHSPAFVPIESLELLNRDLLIIGCNRTNYASIPTAQGWRIVLLRNELPVLISNPIKLEETEPDETSMDKVCADCVAWFTKIRNENPTLLKERTWYHSERFAGHDKGSDFYNHRLSVVLPTWPALFQERDFRRHFQMVFQQNIPAHLTADFHWLGLDDMRAFEKTYKDWLSLMQGNNHKKIHAKAYEIVTLLYGKSSDDRPKSTAPPSRLFPRESLKAVQETFGFAFAFNSTTFHIFSGMRPEDQELLRSKDVRTWKQLKNIDVEETYKWSLLANIKPDRQTVSHWKREAALAQANRWKKLLAYQVQVMREGAQKKHKEDKTGTKLASVFEDLSFESLRIVAAIQKWLDQQAEGTEIPLEFLQFLLVRKHFSRILTSDNFKIFSKVDESLIQLLLQRNICSWSDIGRLTSEEWKDIAFASSGNALPVELKDLQEEAALADLGDWTTLIALQDKNKTDEEIIALYRGLQDLRPSFSAALPPQRNRQQHPFYRLTVAILKDKEAFSINQEAIQKTVARLGIDPFLEPEMLEIFAGIGENIKSVLVDNGIRDWKALAASNPKSLANLLKAASIMVSTSMAEDWISQAALAVQRKWEALENHQAGFADQTKPEELSQTPLMKAFEEWLKENSSPNQNDAE